MLMLESFGRVLMDWVIQSARQRLWPKMRSGKFVGMSQTKGGIVDKVSTTANLV